MTETTQELYSEYLSSERWRALSARVRETAKHRCQLCNKFEKPLHVHHRSYSTLGTEEELSDLIALCAECHTNFHKSTVEWEKMRAFSDALIRTIDALRSAFPPENTERESLDKLKKSITTYMSSVFTEAPTRNNEIRIAVAGEGRKTGKEVVRMPERSP